MNIRISKEDVQHFSREENAVALPDGSGYIGTLNVYHEIHCIVRISIYVYIFELMKYRGDFTSTYTRILTGLASMTIRRKRIESTVVSKLFKPGNLPIGSGIGLINIL